MKRILNSHGKDELYGSKIKFLEVSFYPMGFLIVYSKTTSFVDGQKQELRKFFF